MSAPAQVPISADDLMADPGVLFPEPALDVNGWSAAVLTAGLAVLPWRSHARQAPCRSVPELDAPRRFRQVVVRLAKGRAAGEADLATAWQALEDGGRLLIAGSNDIGIASWAKRLSLTLGVTGTVLANRAHGRVVSFPRTAVTLPRPPVRSVPLPDGTALEVHPGVFSPDGLDGGTAALLAVLAEETATPQVVADVGCAAGHLGLAAARRWPDARILLLDADHRAVRNALVNAAAIAPDRCDCRWWDDGDAWPGDAVDLALLNPPCHAGTAVDLGAARRLFSAIRARRLLVVANRHLPYEADLGRLGAVTCRLQRDGFKVLEVNRG